MATLTLTIPDAQLQRVVVALCASDPANPMPSTVANAKAVVIKWVLNTVTQYETKLAQAAVPVVDTTNLVT